MNRLVIFVVFVWFSPVISGQEVLTLQACLDKVAHKVVKTSAESGNLNRSRANRKYHWCVLLPVVSANAGFNTFFGRKLDPFTNTFAANSVNSLSLGLSSSMQLFDGFSYFHKRNLLDASIRRDELLLDQKRNELRIQAIETYLVWCKLSVQVNLAKERIEKHVQIRSVQRLLIHEGRIDAIDTLKSYNLLLNDQRVLENLNGELKLTAIDLNAQMGESLMAIYQVDPESIAFITEKIQSDELFRRRLAELELEILEIERRENFSGLLPDISLNGLLGTGFSTNNKDYQLSTAPTKAYSRQLTENLYEGIGFYMTVPLFNRGEYFKNRHLNNLQREALAQQIDVSSESLEKQVLELQEKRLIVKAGLEQGALINQNLELICTKTLLLYEEGRITYEEMENALMEWQTHRQDHELMKLNLEILKLYE